MIRDGLGLAGVGIGLGLILAMATGQVLRSWLAHSTGIAAMTMIAGVIAMAVVAGLACYVPARRATKMDPLMALRAE